MGSASPSHHRRDAVVLGAAIGLVGATFGVLAESAGLSLAQSMAMSLLVFTGASQFAAVGVIESGGSPIAAVGSALFLAARNGLYGMRMSERVGSAPAQRLIGAQLVIDESTALSLAQRDEADGRDAFWWMGASVYVFWNVGTLLGVLAGDRIGDPTVWGLDSAFAASFVAMIGPHLQTDPGRVAALAGAAIAIVTVPVTAAGVPVLLAALGVVPGLLVASRKAKR